jgi:hypothetical protein
MPLSTITDHLGRIQESETMPILKAWAPHPIINKNITPGKLPEPLAKMILRQLGS